jgi:hypothetical protein
LLLLFTWGTVKFILKYDFTLSFAVNHFVRQTSVVLVIYVERLTREQVSRVTCDARPRASAVAVTAVGNREREGIDVLF